VVRGKTRGAAFAVDLPIRVAVDGDPPTVLMLYSV